MLATLIALVALAPAAAAATINVTRFDDPGPDATNAIAAANCLPADCSLRRAVMLANSGAGGDVIVLPAGTYMLTLVGDEPAGLMGDLDLTKSMTIQGPSARTTTIQQTAADRVFETHGGTSTISGVTITGGNRTTMPLQGGGVLVEGVTILILQRTAVRGNVVGDGITGAGGGVYNFGTLLVSHSTVSGNQAAGGMGGTGGGLVNATGSANTTMTVIDSTVSGNTAGTAAGVSGIGGGIRNECFSAASVSSSTITANRALGFISQGGNVSDGNSGTCFLSPRESAPRVDGGTNETSFKNTIVSNGTATLFPNCALGTYFSQGHNLEDRSECNFTAAGDQTNTNPMLGPLADNGGPTDTHALLEGSPAIDRGSPDCPPPDDDQRAVSRPQLAACDIGAFEFLLSGSAAGNGGNGGNGGRGPLVTGIGGPGGPAGLCGGGGAGGGGLGAGGGGAGGGGCFSVPVIQSLLSGQVFALVGVAQNGSTARGDALIDSRSLGRARSAKFQLVGTTTKRGLRVGTFKLVIRFPAKARRQLRRLRRARVTLRLVLSAPKGRPLRLTRVVTLKR